jgi:hypothetical protein
MFNACVKISFCTGFGASRTTFCFTCSFSGTAGPFSLFLRSRHSIIKLADFINQLIELSRQIIR